MLKINEPCVGLASSLFLAINLLITVALGIWMPKGAELRPDFHDKPPFFFKEVRLVSLSATLVFDVARFLYSAVLSDISILLVTMRLVATALQMVDHYWLCKNWRTFFVEKKLRGYLWLRAYVVVIVYYGSFAFLDGTMGGGLSTSFGFRLAEGLNYLAWYWWGKKYRIHCGKIVDMSETRRLPSLRYAIMCDAVICAVKTYYDYNVVDDTHGGLIDLYGVVFFALVGLLLRYQEQRQRKIALAFMTSLKESKLEKSRLSEVERETQENQAKADRDRREREEQERERQRQRVEAANLKYSSKAAEGSLKGDALLALVAPVPAATDPADVETGHGGRDGVVPTIAPKMVENNAFDAVVPTDGAADNQAATAAAAVVGGGGGTVNTKDDACIEDCAKEDDEEDDEDDDKDEDEEDNDDDVTFFSIRQNGVELVPKLPPLALAKQTSNLVVPSEVGTDVISTVATSRRASIEKQIRRDHTSHLLMDKVVAVMAQVLAWFVLVHFVEFGINAYYYDKTANASTFPWCADFSFAFNAGSAFVAIQKLFDMFA